MWTTFRFRLEEFDTRAGGSGGTVVVHFFVAMRGSSATTSASSTTRCARTQLHAFAHNLGAVLLLFGVLIFPATGLNAAFYHDGTALLEVLRDDFRLTSKGHDVVKFSLLDFLAVFAGVGAVGGDTEIADIGPSGERLELGISSKIAVDKYFVEIHMTFIHVLD